MPLDTLDVRKGGVFKVVTGTDPAAGAEISQTVTAGKAWELQAMTFQFVTDATAANRRVTVIFDDGTSIFSQVPSEAPQAASVTARYHIAPGLARYGTTLENKGYPLAIPRLVLSGGFRIRTDTTNLQVGDNYGAPVLYVVEYGID